MKTECVISNDVIIMQDNDGCGSNIVIIVYNGVLKDNCGLLQLRSYDSLLVLIVNFIGGLL